MIGLRNENAIVQYLEVIYVYSEFCYFFTSEATEEVLRIKRRNSSTKLLNLEVEEAFKPPKLA